MKLKSWKGKKNIKKFIKEINPVELQNIIVLIDSDKPNLPDSIEEVRAQFGDTEVEVYCAVPTIESWIFADDKLLLHQMAQNKKALLPILYRMPLPEEIPYPKQINFNLFRKNWGNYEFLRHMNIQLAAARTPSLKNFLEGVTRKMAVNLNIEESYARTFSRDILANLVKEVSPAESIIYRTMDGTTYTAEAMIQNIEEGSDIGKLYTADLLRIARELLKRAAEKGKSI